MPSTALKQKVEPSLRTVRLVDQRIALRAQKDEIEKLLREIDGKLLAEVEKNGDFETAAWKVTKVDSESAFIKKELLLEAGVRPSVIAKCTERKPYSYAKVTVKKNGE